MLRSRDIALIAVLSSLTVASNYVLLAFFQVKLMDSLVFISAYLYGFGVGASVAAITWVVYGSLNPLGSAGFPLLLILIVGEMVYVVVGVYLRRVWRRSTDFGTGGSFVNRSLVLGVIGLLSAFAYDLWTNAVDGLLIYQSVQGMIIRISTGAYFMIVHVVADFFFFAFVVPVLIVAISRVTNLRGDDLSA